MCLLEGFLFGVGVAEIEALRLALRALTLEEGDGAPGVAVERVAEPPLELSGPVALPDGAGTAFYFLRGQHAAKLGRNQRERAPVSIFGRGINEENLQGLKTQSLTDFQSVRNETRTHTIQ